MHHLKIRLYPRALLNDNGEYIELAQNDNESYSWNTHDMFNHQCQAQHKGSLQDIEQKYKSKKVDSNPTIWNDNQRISIHVHNQHNRHTNIDIGSITIYVPYSNIQKTQLILSLRGQNSDNAPYYDLSAIHTMPAQQAAEYILSHIPVDNLIQRFIQNFPHQDPHNTSMLHHYHDKLPPHIPCATSQIVNKNNHGPCNFTQEILNIQIPNDEHQYIRIGTNIHQSMINNHDPCINPDEPNDTIIRKLTQHIYESYMQHPDIDSLSQHEQIRIHRVFCDHGHDIANQVYHDAILHRAAHFQSPVFTFPRAEL